MEYEKENVYCRHCEEFHAKVIVFHGFVSDFFYCKRCGRCNNV